MKYRKYLDTEIHESRNLFKDGNVDFQFWFDKTIAERLQGAAIMNMAAFGVPDFIKGKVDRTIYASKKHS
jgi:hypothetical protein